MRDLVNPGELIPSASVWHAPGITPCVETPDHVSVDLTLIVYRTTACAGCPLKEQCTTGQERRVRRWEHEAVLDALAKRMAAMGNAMAVRRETAEHPFATIKTWMGKAHFLCKGLTAVRTEMSLHVL